MFCAILALSNIHIEVLIGKFYNRYIRSTYINLHEIIYCYAAKIMKKNSNNLFKQRFLMHLIHVLSKISIMEYSYRCFNGTIL
jgi:hypothetical protein